MRKRITILFLALISVVGVCWYFCLFTPYNYFSGKSDIENGQVNFISVGLPEIEPNQARINLLHEKYGVRYKNIGCGVIEDESRGIAIYNRVVEAHLEKRNGKAWMEQYLKELEDLRSK